MAGHGFRQVLNIRGMPDALLLLKRQTWNTNRAIVVVSPGETPDDFPGYLRKLRQLAAFRCGFFPFFWGIGIQVVVIAPGLAQSGIDPARHIARVDNQWAIIQSLFLADPSSGTFCSARTWAQFVTGRFQDEISFTLLRFFHAGDHEDSASATTSPEQGQSEGNSRGLHDLF